MSTGKDQGTSRGPETRRTELGPVRPRTRSQGGLGQSSEGAISSSRNQPESSWGEQSSRDLATGCSGELQLLEATEWPSTSQPSYFLSVHHFESPVQSQEFPGPALRSTATMSHHVATPAPRARSQAFLPVSGRQRTDIIEFSFDSSGPFIPVGQGFLEQASVQVPDFCVFFTPNPIGDIGGRVLRSHGTASGHRSSASEVSPEVCLPDQPTGRNLRRRATPPDSAVDSTALGNLPDTTCVLATPRRGRTLSRSSRTRANPPTSGTELLKRTLPPTSISPSKRPVRMRASSPSPPGRRYPLYSEPNESSDSSSSSPDSSSDSSDPSSPRK